MLFNHNLIKLDRMLAFSTTLHVVVLLEAVNPSAAKRFKVSGP